MDWRRLLHRAARKADRAVCWGIAIECLGGELYYAIHAGAFIAVALLIALAAVCWKTTHRRRRRVTNPTRGHTHPNHHGGPP